MKHRKRQKNTRDFLHILERKHVAMLSDFHFLYSIIPYRIFIHNSHTCMHEKVRKWFASTDSCAKFSNIALFYSISFIKWSIFDIYRHIFGWTNYFDTFALHMAIVLFVSPNDCWGEWFSHKYKMFGSLYCYCFRYIWFSHSVQVSHIIFNFFFRSVYSQWFCIYGSNGLNTICFSEHINLTIFPACPGTFIRKDPEKRRFSKF